MKTSPGFDRRRGRTPFHLGQAVVPGLLLMAGLTLGACAGSAPRVVREPAAARNAPAEPERVGELRLPDDAGFFSPTVMGVDATGRLLVADASRGRIAVYAVEGGFAGFLESPTAVTGIGGRLQDVRGIAVSTGGLAIYALDAGSGRVYGWDLGLRFRGVALDAAGEASRARFGACQPEGLALEPSGGALLADRAGDRLLAFDPEWRPDKELGGPGPRGQGLFEPGALAVDARGRIAVADRANVALTELDPGGRIVAAPALPHAPESLVTDPAGGFLVGDVVGDVYRVDGDSVRLLLRAPAGEGGPAFVALSPRSDRLYVARPGAGRVLVYAWGGGGAAP